MATTPTPWKQAARPMLHALVIAVLAFAPVAHALELGSTRVRLGPSLEESDISGGALGLTLMPETAPWWLTWLGEDVHYELAVSLWDAAAFNGDDVYTAHGGPVWHHEPAVLGDRGFVEFGTGIAYVSEPMLDNKDLGGNAHFTTHGIVGWHLDRGERWHLGMRARHTSNAGTESPNPGLDIVMLELGYHFAGGA